MQVNLDSQIEARSRRQRSSKNDNDKVIGLWGSIALLVNNITGPGLVILPLAFQTTGYAGLTLIITLYTLMSLVCIFFVAETMTRIPGNERFQNSVEFMDLVRTYFSPRVHLVVLALFLVSCVGTNIGNIVESAQTIDEAMLAFGSACALRLSPHPGFTCITKEEASSDSVFGNDWVISVGLLILVVVTIPLGFLNLGDNIYIQHGAFLGLLIISLVWSIYFLTLDIHTENLPAIGASGSSIGFLLFNFSFVLTVPAWINEKHSSVDLRKASTRASIIGVLLMVIPPLLAALVLNFKSGEDMLAILTGKSSPLPIRIFSYAFPIFSLVTSIPVISIVMRYNLISNNICSRPAAQFWAVIFPWIISILFYGGDMINFLMTWVGIGTAGVLNFIVPAALYLTTTRYNLLDTYDVSLEDRRLVDDDHRRGINGDSKKTDAFLDDDSDSEGANPSSRPGFNALPNWQRGRALLLPWMIIIFTVAAMVFATVMAIVKGGKSEILS